MDLKTLAVFCLLFMLLAFLAGCTMQEPTVTPAPEPTKEPTPEKTPTPLPKTPSPAQALETPTPVPADFQTKTFNVRDVSLKISFPSDWKISGSDRVYGKTNIGILMVSEQMHFSDCDKPLIECTNEKIAYVGWKEFRLGHCDRSAVWRLSYEQANSLQKQLWIDFPEKGRGVLILCTAYYEAKENHVCDKIFEFIEC